MEEEKARQEASGSAGAVRAAWVRRGTACFVRAAAVTAPITAGARRVQQNLKVGGSIIRQHPSTLAVPLLMMAMLLALGLWGVIWGANREAEQSKQRALSFARTFMTDYQKRVKAIDQPLLYTSIKIREQPKSWAALNASLSQIMPDIINMTGAGQQMSLLYVCPQGKIAANFISRGALPVGYDFLGMKFPGRYQRMDAIERGGTLLVGPYWNHVPGNASAGISARTIMMVTYLMPVYVNVSTPNQPPYPTDVPVATNCTVCSAVHKNGEVFWGLVGALKRIDNIMNPAVFAEAKYRFEMIAPLRDGFSATAPQDSPPTPVANSTHPVRDPVYVSAGMDSTTAQWTLAISPASGSWRPPWEDAMLAVVIVVSVALATMQFLALFSWRQHQLLLKALLPKNVLDQLQHSHDYSSTAVSDIVTGTPAETMLKIIGIAMQGELPNLTDLVLMRTALLRRADMYRPVDLGAKIKAANVDSDVARLLVQQLDGSGGDIMAMSFTSHRSAKSVAADQDLSGFRFGSQSSITNSSALYDNLRDALHMLVSNGESDDIDTSIAMEDSGDFNKCITVGDETVTTVPFPAYDSPPVSSSSPCNIRSPSRIRDPTEVAREEPAAQLKSPMPVASKDDATTMVLLDKAAASATVPRHKYLDDLERRLNASNEWQFDVMALAAASKGHALSTLGFYVLSATGLMDKFKLKRAVVARYISRVEGMYLNNPYHNAAHAADVLQGMHVQLQRGGLAGTYANPLAQLACYFAAIVHDLGHRGRTNDFLCASGDPLAIRYNDRAPMENHHVSEAFALLQEPGLDFLQPLTKDQRTTLRRLVIEMVLGTDMKQHFGLVSQFKTLHSCAASGGGKDGTGAPSADNRGRMRRTSVAGARRSSAGGEPFQPPELDDAGKLLTLQVALKCSDLGHLSAPLDVHKSWVAGLEEEFFLQGDAERAAGMRVSPLFDRTKPGITKSQVGFFEFAGLPLFKAMAAALPAMQPLLDGIEANYRYWQEYVPSTAQLPKQLDTATNNK